MQYLLLPPVAAHAPAVPLMSSLWDSRRAALASCLRRSDLITWVQQQLRHSKDEIEALHVANGALLCLLLARTHPHARVALPAVEWDALERRHNVALFVQGITTLVDNQDVEADALKRLQAITQEAEADVEALFQWLRAVTVDSAAAAAAANAPLPLPPPTPTSGRSAQATATAAAASSSTMMASGIPRFKPKQSQIPTRATKIPRIALHTSSHEVITTTSTSSSSSSGHGGSQGQIAMPSRLPMLGRKRPREHSPASPTPSTVSVASSHVSRAETAAPSETSESVATRSASGASIGADAATVKLELDADLRRQHDVDVARCLQQDLVRDRVHMLLKMTSMRREIDYYYDLLVEMEQLAMEQLAHDPENALAQQIQAVIGAQPVAKPLLPAEPTTSTTAATTPTIEEGSTDKTTAAVRSEGSEVTIAVDTPANDNNKAR